MNPVYIARTREVAARSIGGEMMILSARDSRLFSLNHSATAIWLGADGVTPLATIVDRVCREYDVEPAIALRDARELIDGLAAQGVLHVSDTPFAEAS
jgi:hypothetical protein